MRSRTRASAGRPWWSWISPRWYSYSPASSAPSCSEANARCGEAAVAAAVEGEDAAAAGDHPAGRLLGRDHQGVPAGRQLVQMAAALYVSRQPAALTLPLRGRSR